MSKQKMNPFAPIIVFLGAGASAFAGYRTFWSFRDLIFNNNVRSQEKCPSLRSSTVPLLQEIEQSLENTFRKPPTHDNYMWRLDAYKHFCEAALRGDVIGNHWASALGNSNLWSTLGPFQQQVKDAVDDLTCTTLHHYAQNRVQVLGTGANTADLLGNIKSFYEDLARINNREKPYLPIFTTNYDLLFEDLWTDSILSPSPIPLVNGIPSLVTEGARWETKEYARREGIHLFRLHGCVCWSYRGFGDPYVYYHRKHPKEEHLCVMTPGREIYRGKNPHALGFQEFFHHLKVCKLVIFIGFSFRDDDVMHLLLSGLAQRGSKEIQLLSVNPGFPSSEIRTILEEAATRTPFPVRILEKKEMQDLQDMKFGEGKTCQVILEQAERVAQLP